MDQYNVKLTFPPGEKVQTWYTRIPSEVYEAILNRDQISDGGRLQLLQQLAGHEKPNDHDCQYWVLNLAKVIHMTPWEPKPGCGIVREWPDAI